MQLGFAKYRKFLSSRVGMPFASRVSECDQRGLFCWDVLDRLTSLLVGPAKKLYIPVRSYHIESFYGGTSDVESLARHSYV